MKVWDFRLNQGGVCELSVPEGWNSALIVLRGTRLVNGHHPTQGASGATESRSSTVSIEANNDNVVLLLRGEPIDEPIVGQGPTLLTGKAFHPKGTSTLSDLKEKHESHACPVVQNWSRTNLRHSGRNYEYTESFSSALSGELFVSFSIPLSSL